MTYQIQKLSHLRIVDGQSGQGKQSFFLFQAHIYFDFVNPHVLFFRSVAKYLKLLFENESGTGRKMIEMDRLLIGKTRKEASRMFFETLVCELSLKSGR